MEGKAQVSWRGQKAFDDPLLPGEYIQTGWTQLSPSPSDNSPVSRCVFYFTPTFEHLTQFFFFFFLAH